MSEILLDNNVKVIVLQSEGEKTFCAGASFDELISIKDFDQGKKYFWRNRQCRLSLYNP